MIKIDSFLQLIYRYGLRDYLLEWAGIFRYLGARSEGFKLQEWQALNRAQIHHTIIQSLFRILGEQKLVIEDTGRYILTQENELQRFFETMHVITEVVPMESYNKTEDKLLWTYWSDHVKTPSRITERFHYLNSWIQHLIQTTTKRLVFFAPYYSVAGMKHLSVSLRSLLEFRHDVRVDWIIGEADNIENQRAFSYLFQHLGPSPLLRVFQPADAFEQGLVFHAKVLLSDDERGYLGSANFSHRGLHNQFELGVSLTKDQSSSLTLLIDHWIASSQIIPFTS